jgi:hypothetical protein
VIERYRRIDYGHLIIDVTIDDPGAYQKPFSATQEMHLRPGWEPMDVHLRGEQHGSSAFTWAVTEQGMQSYFF